MLLVSLPSCPRYKTLTVMGLMFVVLHFQIPHTLSDWNLPVLVSEKLSLWNCEAEQEQANQQANNAEVNMHGSSRVLCKSSRKESKNTPSER